MLLNLRQVIKGIIRIVGNKWAINLQCNIIYQSSLKSEFVDRFRVDLVVIRLWLEFQGFFCEIHYVAHIALVYIHVIRHFFLWILLREKSTCLCVVDPTKFKGSVLKDSQHLAFFSVPGFADLVRAEKPE